MMIVLVQFCLIQVVWCVFILVFCVVQKVLVLVIYWFLLNRLVMVVSLFVFMLNSVFFIGIDCLLNSYDFNWWLVGRQVFLLLVSVSYVFCWFLDVIVRWCMVVVLICFLWQRLWIVGSRLLSVSMCLMVRLGKLKVVVMFFILWFLWMRWVKFFYCVILLGLSCVMFLIIDVLMVVVLLFLLRIVYGIGLVVVLFVVCCFLVIIFVVWKW